MALPEEILEQLERENESALTADGFDSCLIGLCHQFGRPTVACYDRDKCIRKLMEDGMSHEEAEEFFEFNVIGSGMGKNTPVFVKLFT